MGVPETMVRLVDEGVFIRPDGTLADAAEACALDADACRANSMAWQVMSAHNTSGNMEHLSLRFDALASPDNNYVSILQTATASGLTRFPVPYVLSNCHNTLCAVGGTINEDDHVFGRDNARRYGGIFVPPYKAVIHQFMREMMAGCGKMILGSDSHTRYGALGTMGIGEGGGEIAKQLLSQTYDIARPEVVAVRLTGVPRPGVGPHDVALALVGATFASGFTKNRVLEFVGEGISSLPVEFRLGVDVMTTESGALSSIWMTDEPVRAYLAERGREADWRPLAPAGTTYYDRLVDIDLSRVECMLALPYHPSNVMTIDEFNEDPRTHLEQAVGDGLDLTGKFVGEGLHVDQALVSGCSGGLFSNIAAMADILDGHVISGADTALGINPASQPTLAAMASTGVLARLIQAGATVRPCICGPCFGVSDVPANNQLSIRHVTRNYPNREGAKPGRGQHAASILMDARSIAATIANGGILCAASDMDVAWRSYEPGFDAGYYPSQIFNGWGHAEPGAPVRKGPNIADWPSVAPLGRHLLLRVTGAYADPVTTDDLSPSGDAVAWRSNPEKLAEFTMINRDPGFVARSREVARAERARLAGEPLDAEAASALRRACEELGCDAADVMIAGVLVGDNVGDGSSREQAASSQKIVGGYADIACEYATKRYRSNLINWGILPILCAEAPTLNQGDWLLVADARGVVDRAGEPFEIRDITGGQVLTADMGEMTDEEKATLKAGCLINRNRERR